MLKPTRVQDKVSLFYEKMAQLTSFSNKNGFYNAEFNAMINMLSFLSVLMKSVFITLSFFFYIGLNRLIVLGGGQIEILFYFIFCFGQFGEKLLNWRRRTLNSAWSPGHGMSTRPQPLVRSCTSSRLHYDGVEQC